MATETILRPGEIKDILLREIEAADLHELDVEEVGTVLEVKDGIARIYGLGKAMAGEMLEVTSSETGEKITALALNLEETSVGVIILGEFTQIHEGETVADIPVSALTDEAPLYERPMTAPGPKSKVQSPKSEDQGPESKDQSTKIKDQNHHDSLLKLLASPNLASGNALPRPRSQAVERQLRAAVASS